MASERTDLDWIMFWRNGETHTDVVLFYGNDDRWPRDGFAVTPHFGRVDRAAILETRTAPGAPEVG